MKWTRVFTALTLLVAVLALSSARAQAAPTPVIPAFVHSSSFHDNSTGMTIPTSLSGGVSKDDLVVVSATFNDDGTTTGACSDSQSNSYTQAISYYNAGNSQSVLTCYAKASTTGALTVTVNLSATQTYREMVVSEYNGLASTLAVDTTSGSGGYVTTGSDHILGGTITTRSNGDLIYGAFFNASWEGSGFTLRDNSTDLMTEDEVQANAGSIQAKAGKGFDSQFTGNTVAFRSIGLASNTTASVTIDPTFTFSIGNQASACNGEANFVGGAGGTSAVTLAHLTSGNNVSGGQALTVASNAGSGFAVYVHGTQSANNLRSTGHNWADTSGTYSVPATLSGESFGFTYKDSTVSTSVTNPGSNLFVALDNTNRAVMGSATSGTGNGCVSFDAESTGATPAGSYSATVVYTAVPVF